MNSLHIPYRKSFDDLPLEEVAQRLLKEGVVLSIDQVNWPRKYPDCPETKVFMAHDEQSLYILFGVKGKQLRALAVEDQQAVWEDSCVEFFCQEFGEPYYMNFEVNCIGVMAAARRLGQNEGVNLLNAEEMHQIQRFSSLKKEKIEEKDGVFEWKVGISIPLRLICPDFDGFPLPLQANFYKCADGTKSPHFVSWQPIDLPQPLFHCPEFFGTIILDA